MKSVACLRCNIQMNYICREKIQLGQTGWILGDLSNLFAGALEVDIYSCPQCGKIEFFQTENTDFEEAIPQKSALSVANLTILTIQNVRFASSTTTLNEDTQYIDKFPFIGLV